MAVIGEVSGLPQKRVQQLAEYRSALIRNIETDKAYGIIGAAINQVAVSYGTRQEPEAQTLDECIRLVGAKFSHLSPLEIREAYRMWVAEELNIDGGKAEMWGGHINARNLGAVLSAYNKWRKRDMAKYLNAVEEARQREEREAKERDARENFEAQLFEELEVAVKEMNDWRDVKPYWFRSLWKRSLIKMSTEQIEGIKQEAARLAKEEKEAREREAKESGRLFEHIAEPEGIEVAIRRRLAVWRYYIIPARAKL